MNSRSARPPRKPLNPTGVRSIAAKHLVGALLIGLGACVPAWSQADDTPVTIETPAPPSILDGELFYQLLIGELKLLENDPGAAYSLMLDAARSTGQPELFRRAIEIALMGKAGQPALNAAKDWAKRHPTADEPHRFVLQILLALNRPAEIVAPLKTLIKLTPLGKRNEVINAIPQTVGRAPDKATAAKAVAEALSSYTKDRSTAASAWSAIGRMQLEAKDPAQALESATKASQAEPQSFPATVLALDLLERGQPAAQPLIERYLQATKQEKTGDHNRVQLNYARVLYELDKTDEALLQVQELAQSLPDQAEVWLLLGNMLSRKGLAAEAEKALLRFLELSDALTSQPIRSARDQAYLILAQLAEQRQDFATSKSWLDRIEDTEASWSMPLRRAMLLARQDRLEEARTLIRQLPGQSPEHLQRKILIEAQLLRDLGHFNLAYEVLARGVEQFPDHADMRYEMAMAAERAGQLPAMEQALRQLIARHPDYYHAYNALGYSLADRNERLDEARALILKALEMAPNDAFILDSLGWVEFRRGQLPEALAALQKAHQLRPDAEIAAHLGEVHWVMGQRQEARKVWQQGLQHDPDNDTLLSTLKRLQVEP